MQAEGKAALIVKNIFKTLDELGEKHDNLDDDAIGITIMVNGKRLFYVGKIGMTNPYEELKATVINALEQVNLKHTLDLVAEIASDWVLKNKKLEEAADVLGNH